MASYNDERNWDQDELDRARNLAKDNVVSEGASVPQAAKIRSQETLDSQEPSPVLKGDRPTTEDEREEVAAAGDTSDDREAAKAMFEADTKKNEESK